MSHAKERADKTCLNCGTEVVGKYCHKCGQENIEIKENFLSLIRHFIEDITHFDGKFFNTIKVLLFKPGFLTKEYLKGKRAAYFHPIRMYVFTSFFFFLIYFTFYQSDKDFAANQVSTVEKSNKEKAKDTIADAILKSFYEDSTVKERKYTVAEYDSLIKTGAIKDNWLEQQAIRKTLHLSEKYKGNKGQMMTDFFKKSIHTFPQVLFITLPLIALLLMLLNIRRTGEFYFVHHAIYTIHVYCASFIFMLLGLWLNSLLKLVHLENGFINSFLTFLLYTISFYYLYKSMKVFYGQSVLKTTTKYFILLFLSLFIFTFSFIIMFIFALMTL
jgi:hypothetical protein